MLPRKHPLIFLRTVIWCVRESDGNVAQRWSFRPVHSWGPARQLLWEFSKKTRLRNFWSQKIKPYKPCTHTCKYEHCCGVCSTSPTSLRTPVIWWCWVYNERIVLKTSCPHSFWMIDSCGKPLVLHTHTHTHIHKLYRYSSMQEPKAKDFVFLLEF